LNNSDLQDSGNTAVDFFKANISITVVTAENNYFVSVKDWPKLNSYTVPIRSILKVLNNYLKKNLILWDHTKKHYCLFLENQLICFGAIKIQRNIIH